MVYERARIVVRQHVLSPQHGLDRVKLSIQRGPLGSFDRADGELLARLWNDHFERGDHLKADHNILCQTVSDSLPDCLVSGGAAVPYPGGRVISEVVTDPAGDG